MAAIALGGLGACSTLEQAVAADDGAADGSGTAPGNDGAVSTAADGDAPGPAATGDGSNDDGATSDGPVPPEGCGDGVVDPGEACDDADDDDTDDCTTLCQAPSCEDALQSGDETDVDCGGSCEGCAVGGTCDDVGDCAFALTCGDGSQCTFPPDCLQLLKAWPEANTGDYDIDPDADGTPMNVACDMDHEGGGWTRVLSEDFAKSDGAEWSETSIYTCGELGAMLGRFGQAEGDVQREVDLLGIAHSQARLLARYFKMDSWDNEHGYAYIDGVRVWMIECNYLGCGESNQCGGAEPDGGHIVDRTSDHADPGMKLAFGSDLDEQSNNEAWGVDDIEVWIR